MKHYSPHSRLLCATMILSTPLCQPLMAQDAAPGTNIALGKPVALSPVPNSPEPGNKPEKLTDGNPVVPIVTKEDSTAMWVQPGAVGWAYTNPAAIVVDLGKVQPISGFSYRTAAGIADVTWPSAIHMAVSDDQKTWRYAGDLVALSAKPVVDLKYREFTFSTKEVKAKGRYVAFGPASQLYITTDEVEVFAGDPAWLDQPDNTIVYPNDASTVLEYLASLTVKQGQTRRVDIDRRAIGDAIRNSRLTSRHKADLLGKLTATGQSKTVEPLPGKNFKTIAPISAEHRQVLAVRGEFLAALGFKPLTVWSQHRYKWLPLLNVPSEGPKPALTFSMLGNQYRSDSFLLTNASATAQTVQLKVSGAPQNAQGGWLQVNAVEWTDTQQGVVVADALVPVAEENGVYSVTVPAGITRKLWFLVDSSKLPACNFKGSVAVESGTFKSIVPLSVAIARVAMNRPRISLGMWDESEAAEIGASLGITMKNREAALKLMQSHYVDTAWGRASTMPWPKAADFDADGNLISKLDFSRLDAWIKHWPNARRFFNFINSGTEFAGAKMGTPVFNARVGSWGTAISQHLTEIGVDPTTFGFMLIDEARTDEHDEIVAAWSTALKASVPELKIFINPHWLRPDQRPNQLALVQADVLSPVQPNYYRGGAPVKAYFENLQKQGKELWFYQCAGPVRLFDPQQYYRYQAWHVYSVGGTGQGFWSFHDIGNGSKTSWNDYANAPYFSYTPQFIDVDTMNSSVHWESVREGMEDYEELAMLRDAIAASKSESLKKQAQKVHDAAVDAVTFVGRNLKPRYDTPRFSVFPPYDWEKTNYDAGLADRHLLKVRAMLIKLHAANEQ